MFTRAHIAALRTLQQHWGEENVVLIGAAALSVFLDMGWRATADVDLTVAASVDDVLAVGDLLDGWTRHPFQEQRFDGPDNSRLDIVPASEQLRAAGSLTWPGGFEMNLAGLRLAFAHAERMQLEPGIRLRVAPPEAILVLKVAAYLDRPSQRRDDLTDIAHILEERVSADDDARYSETVMDLELTYEQAGPFVVGQRVACLLDEQEAQLLSEFLERALDPEDAAAIRQLISRHGPISWRGDTDGVLPRLVAFSAGLGDRTGGT